MRSAIAVGAAIWFVGAAWLNQFEPTGSDFDQVIEVVHGVAQTLFVGLAILSLAAVDWQEVRAFFDVSVNPTVAPDAPDTEEP
jgi:hypothetical protein